MTSQYKKFMQLIAKWPLDTTKGERDLGQVIRNKVKVAFEANNTKDLDTKYCNRQYTSLNKLADNHFKNKYKRKETSSATGLTPEECKVLISNEGLAYLKEEQKGFFKKIFYKS